jgi:hypothetical protein
MNTFIEDKNFKKNFTFFFMNHSDKMNQPATSLLPPLDGCGCRMLELLGKIAPSLSWTGRVDYGLIRINQKKIRETKTFAVNRKLIFLILVKDSSPVRHRKTGKNMFLIHTKFVKSL